MADEKLSDLPSVTPATGDLLYLVDISDTTDSAGGSSKKTTVADVLALVSGSGTVTSVSVTTANGVSGTVATATTTPAITLTLGAITPSSVNGVAISGNSTPTLAVTGAAAVSGTNTGDVANTALTTGTLAQFAATTSAQLAGVLTDETGSGAAVFATGPTIAAPVLTGTVTVRQTGGTPGTDEATHTHTGARYEIRSYDGDIRLIGTRTVCAQHSNTSLGAIIECGKTMVRTSISGNSACETDPALGLSLSSAMPILWSSGADAGTGFVLGLARVASRVIGVTDGSTGGGTLSSVPLTPTQITSNQNNYAPGVAHTYRLSTDASRDITGLSISQVSGQWGRIFNVGSFNLVLKHQDANSTAANRFLSVTGADITLAPDEGAGYEYDSTTSRFRAWKL